MFTAKDLPEGWAVQVETVRNYTFFDKEKPRYILWCITPHKNTGCLIDYFVSSKNWVIHTPTQEGLSYPEAVNLVVTLIRLGEAERLCNEK